MWMKWCGIAFLWHSRSEGKKRFARISATMCFGSEGREQSNNCHFIVERNTIKGWAGLDVSWSGVEFLGWRNKSCLSSDEPEVGAWRLKVPLLTSTKRKINRLTFSRSLSFSSPLFRLNGAGSLIKNSGHLMDSSESCEVCCASCLRWTLEPCAL